jgi:hypothetical protein
VETTPRHAIDCEYQPKSAECDGIDCSCKETRLTAEQFYKTWPVSIFNESDPLACMFELMEAFRNKSEKQ